MADHVSYWTISRQINANVDRHIASLKSEQQIHVDFDESFSNENRRDYTENLAQNVSRADSRINSQPNLSIDLENVHPSVDIETYYDGNETYLNSEDIERNMTYLLSDTDSESSDSSDECRENLHESLREWAIKIYQIFHSEICLKFLDRRIQICQKILEHFYVQKLVTI